MSLIQDALKKVQKERDKIQNPEMDEKEESDATALTASNSIPPSMKKRWIIIGSLLGFLTIVTVIASFLLKQPVQTKPKKVFDINELKAYKKQIAKSRAENQQKQQKSNPSQIQSATVVNDPKTDAGTKEAGINRSTPTLIKGNETGTPLQKQSQPVTGKLKADPELEKLRESRKQRTEQFKRQPVVRPVNRYVRQVPVNKSRKNRVRKGTQKRIPKIEQYIRQGDDLYRKKQYLESVAMYKKALKIKRSKALYLDIYQCYKKTGHLVLLRGYIEEALSHYPNDPFFNRVIGILLFREKKYTAALSNFNKVLRQDRNDSNILTYKGLCLFHLKHFEDSLEIFKRILQIDKKKIASYYYIGLIYDNLKDYKTAIDYYRIFEKYNGMNKNFRHRNWIRRRIMILQRSLK